MNAFKTMLVPAAVTLFLGMTSCQNEVARSVSSPEETVPVVSTELRGLTFTFTMPGQEGISVDTRAIHDEPEWTIDKMWLYEFSADGTKLLKAPLDITNNLKRKSVAAQYTYPVEKIGAGNEGVRQFFFVANLESAPGSVGDSFEKVKDQVLAMEMSGASTDILTKHGSSYRIPMTALATDGTNGTSHNITYAAKKHAEVKMVRTVARIDVVNRIPEFKIIGLELNDTYAHSYLHTTYKTVRHTGSRVSGVKPFAEIPASGFTGSRDGSKKIRKAFYLYEGENGDTECTNVVITAEFGGKTIKYRIPFKKKNAATGEFSDPVPVKRNHLYTIVVGGEKPDDDTPKPGDDPKYNNVNFTLLDEEPWTLHELKELVSLIEVSGAGFVATDVNAGTLTIEKAAGKTDLALKTDFTKHKAFSAQTKAFWLTLDLDRNDGKLSVSATENTTGKERTAKIQVVTDALDGEIYTITVKQKAL